MRVRKSNIFSNFLKKSNKTLLFLKTFHIKYISMKRSSTVEKMWREPQVPHPPWFTSVTLNIKNFTNLSVAAIALKDGVKSEFTRFTFLVKQKFTLPLLLAVCKNDPDGGSVKRVIEGIWGCPPRTYVTNFKTISRRALTSSEHFIVEVSYTLTEESFENIYLNEGECMFTRRLEVELGLAKDTVSTISNSIMVRVEVIPPPPNGLPSNPQELLQSTKSLLDTQTNIVFGIFGVEGDNVTKTNLDLCTGGIWDLSVSIPIFSNAL